MAKPFILVIDQGTTATGVSIVDSQGRMIASSDKEFPQYFPQIGWVEHNADEIWQSVLKGITECFQKSRLTSKDIETIGITNQRETVVAWDEESGEVLAPAIVWQDRRTAPFCEKLKKAGRSMVIQKKTGLVLDPYFSATKMNWLLNHNDRVGLAARKGSLAFGTIDSFLVYKLSGGQSHVTDVSNASRTSLMNLKTLDWDSELLKIFAVPESSLPVITHSSGDISRTHGIEILHDGISISGMAGDQQAALFGQSCFKKGEGKITYGTGSFLLLNTGTTPVFSKKGLLTTVAWQLQDQKPVYALEGGAFMCGAAVQWIRDEMKWLEKSSDIEALANKVTDRGGVEVVPTFSGLGAPHWNPLARAMIAGLSRGTKKEHIARALLESLALQNCDILSAMEKDLKSKIKNVRVDGGASANDLLMQMQADYLGVRVERPRQIETTTMGAAYLAGLGCGIWSSANQIQKIWQSDRVFKSGITSKQRNERFETWNRAVKAVQILSGL